MLDAIRRFFDNNISAGGGYDVAGLEQALRTATAALLVEIMHADYEVRNSEKDVIRRVLCTSFELSSGDADHLIELAGQELDEAADYYQFTSLINKNFDAAQKIRVVENLWKVAFADGTLDKYEEHIVRKIADLLYVPHSDFIAAKHRARPGSQS